MKPLWKSQAEFYSQFEVLRDKKLEKTSWIFSKECKQFLAERFEMSEEDIWICEATPKYKGKFADKVLIKVDDEAIPYESLLPADRNSYSQDVQPFFYIYVDGDKIDRKENMMRALNEEIKKYVFNTKTKVERQ